MDKSEKGEDRMSELTRQMDAVRGRMKEMRQEVRLEVQRKLDEMRDNINLARSKMKTQDSDGVQRLTVELEALWEGIRMTFERKEDSGEGPDIKPV